MDRKRVIVVAYRTVAVGLLVGCLTVLLDLLATAGALRHRQLLEVERATEEDRTLRTWHTEFHQTIQQLDTRVTALEQDPQHISWFSTPEEYYNALPHLHVQIGLDEMRQRFQRWPQQGRDGYRAYQVSRLIHLLTGQPLATTPDISPNPEMAIDYSQLTPAALDRVRREQVELTLWTLAALDGNQKLDPSTGRPMP